MREVLVNRLGGLSLPGKSVARLTDLPDMILDVYRGRKTTIQQQQQQQQIPPTHRLHGRVASLPRSLGGSSSRKTHHYRYLFSVLIYNIMYFLYCNLYE